MQRNLIDVMCIQESQQPNSDHYTREDGYKVILSGTAKENKERAGVGFIIARALKNKIVGFCQFSDRIASLKFKTRGGITVLVSASAPQHPVSHGVGQPPQEGSTTST